MARADGSFSPIFSLLEVDRLHNHVQLAQIALMLAYSSSTSNSRRLQLGKRLWTDDMRNGRRQGVCKERGST
jgi:hypothetical protein